MKRLGIFLCGAALCFSLPASGWSQVKLQNNVGDETVEKILQSLELKYEKKERKLKNDTTISFYDFKRGEVPYRFYNYRSDLWIESHFDKQLKPEDVNTWNADAKFSRAVIITQKDKTILSLESQLDCLGGVTDAIIKQFVNRFEEEAKKFVKTFPK